MARKIVGVLAGLVVWFVLIFLIGFILRETWLAYARVADAMTFTLPMLLARLTISVFATLAMGFASATISRSTHASLTAAVILLIVFIPQHIVLWNTFPLWYHAFFLLSLIPLSYAGGRMARWKPSGTPQTALIS